MMENLTTVDEKTGEPHVKIKFTLDNGETLFFEPSKVPRELSSEAKEILDYLDSHVLILNESASSGQKNLELIQVLINYMQYGFEFSEFRNHPVQFKFTREDKEFQVTSFRHLILNLIMWHPLICIRDIMDTDDYINEDMIITPSMFKDFGRKFIQNYMNKWYLLRYRTMLDTRQFSRIIGKTMFTLTRISKNFSPFIGLSISIDMFRELEKKIPGYHDFLYYHLDETKQPNEIEQDAKKAADDHLRLIVDDPEYNMFKSLIQDVKKAQLAEVQTVTAMKPGFDTMVIPKPLNYNWVTGNIGTIPKFYINCIAGRKAAIINNEFMGTAGHLLILVAISSNSVKLSKTTTDCNTVNPVCIEVRSKTHLQKISGRRYRIGNEKTYHTIDANKDTDLIGKTIWMRSPLTCACRDGVCRECYGDLYYVNQYLNSAGELAAVIVMNPATQSILSAKHHQGTSSKPISMGEDFSKFFAITSTDIVISPSAEDITGYSLVIKRDDFKCSDPDEDELDKFFNSKRVKTRRKKKSDEDDESGDDDVAEMRYFTNRFFVIKNSVKKSKDDDTESEVYEFKDAYGKNLFMHDDFVSRLNLFEEDGEEMLAIPLESISNDEFIFVAEVDNNELTRPMKAIERLINNRYHEGCDTIDEIAQKMLDLLVQAQLDATSVHGEMLMYKLIRRSDNILKRPNFTKPIFRDEYQILTIKTSLKKDPSINTAMSTPFLKYQLIQDPVTFDKRATSDYDAMYRMFTDEENLSIVSRDWDADEAELMNADWIYTGSQTVQINRTTNV